MLYGERPWGAEPASWQGHFSVSHVDDSQALLASVAKYKYMQGLQPSSHMDALQAKGRRLKTLPDTAHHPGWLLEA